MISLIDHIIGIYEMPNIYENKLPNPRSLSTYFIKDENLADLKKTTMMAYWAIFISHDLSHTAVSTFGTHITLNNLIDH